MSWLYLFLAILFEILGTTFLKLSNGFSQFWARMGRELYQRLSGLISLLSGHRRFQKRVARSPTQPGV